MNAVWNSYGQLCGCPEIFKKSCKFFCRELDIRVEQRVRAGYSEMGKSGSREGSAQTYRRNAARRCFPTLPDFLCEP